MVIAENSAFTMLSFWILHDKHLFLCPMKRRRYIAWVLMLVSIIMLTASVLPHHHHREILCLQHDMTLCGCQCSVQHQQHNNSSDENHTCNAGCVTKFKSVTPDRAQDSVSPDYSFCLLLYTVTDVLALSLRLLFLLGSCNSKSGHDHEGHDHGTEEAHNHDHEGHDHNHEGHDHEKENHDHENEGHEGHNHEAEASAAGHSDEIILAPEKAKAAGVESEIIRPESFRQVITTSGQVQAAQGDESVVVANVAGVVSFRHPVTDGMSVSKGAPILNISRIVWCRKVTMCR